MNNFNEPDPEWDYAFIYETLTQGNAKLSQLIDELAEQEDPTPEFDTKLYQNLMVLAGSIIQVAQKLEPSYEQN